MAASLGPLRAITVHCGWDIEKVMVMVECDGSCSPQKMPAIEEDDEAIEVMELQERKLSHG